MESYKVWFVVSDFAHLIFLRFIHDIKCASKYSLVFKICLCESDRAGETKEERFHLLIHSSMATVTSAGPGWSQEA